MGFLCSQRELFARDDLIKDIRPLNFRAVECLSSPVTVKDTNICTYGALISFYFLISHFT